MAFFKKYNGTTNARLLRMERAIWTLIYGGLLMLVLAYFAHEKQGVDVILLQIIGGVAVAAGVVLVFVRSRLHEER
jgi:hypothetical protein